MIIQESSQMYLKTIYILSLEKDNVRSIDISKKMRLSKPSVSRAMKNLSNEEYISIDDDGHITLLTKGLKIALKMYERNNILKQYFTILGVDKKTAEEDACKIEHVISEETFNKIKNLVK